MGSGDQSGARSAVREETGLAADLVRRVRKRDAAAEADLVARYRGGVTMILRRILKDPALADDLAQEVLRIALESLRQDRIEDGEKLAAYLWGIARNLASAERRRRERHPEIAASEPLVDPAMRPDERLLRNEQARVVRQTVATLAPRDRVVLREFYLNSTPKDTICRLLRLTPAQFDVIKWRALQRLRPLLRARLGRHD